jgi:uncharacterized protein with HEPN domain
MSKGYRTILLYIRDILDSIEKIEKFCHDMSYDQFMADEKTRDAVIRNLEIIGEAAKNIPDAMKTKSASVAWRSMTGMRDKLVHEYFGVSYSIVWETIKNDLAALKSQMKELYRSIEQEK